MEPQETQITQEPSFSFSEKLHIFKNKYISKKTVGVIIALLIAVNIPVALYLVQQRQNVKQHASTNGSITILDAATNQAITQTQTTDVKLQILLPENWELQQASPSGRLNIIANVFAQEATPSATPEPPTPTTASPSASATPEKHFLNTITINNTELGGDNNAIRTITGPELITTLANPIPWKLNSLLPNETSAQRRVVIKYIDTTGNIVSTFSEITLQSPNPQTSPIATPSATLSPNPIASPSATPVASPSATISAIPTITLIPTPTIVPGDTAFTVKVGLQGIGKGGNPTPIHPQRTFVITLFDNTGIAISTKSAMFAFNTATNIFEGQIDMGKPTAGNYTVKAKTDKFLTKVISNILPIVAGTTNYTFPTIPTLVAGDLNNDNLLNIEDFNLYKNCLGKNTADCIASSDLNDDGKTDTLIPAPMFLDYRLLISNFSLQKGE